MRPRRIRLLAAALGCAVMTVLGLVARAPAAAGGSGAPTAVVAGYFAALDPSLPVSEIDASRLTDVIYAFGDVDERGRCALGDPAIDVGPPGAAPGPGGDFGALAALRAAHPALRTEISIGGWSGSAGFSRAAATGRGRAMLVRSCIDLFLRRWPGVFDGIDIDWEFPVVGGASATAASPADRADAALLLADFRHGLDALGAATHRHYLLTVAMPAFGTAGGDGYTPSTSWDLPALARQVDWMNLMTYDLAGSGSATTGFASPLHAAGATAAAARPADSIDGAVRYYEAAGVPADEIVIGAPFYGHLFVGVHSVHHGLFEPFRRLGAVPSYARIAAGRPSAAEVHWSATAQEPWIYDHGTYSFLTYDDPAAMSAKANYAVGHHLRGVMIWELGMDDARHSLLDALSGPVLAAAAARSDG